ncbi:MAG TPA: hypothetical protein PKY15_05280 [Methanoregulaceae archaeon]|nr:hypothetical protein [Methanolinea sp.]MDD5048450.1 hypothetical protein [Methanoregulaceae archaeon]HQC12754.1 hypothetical protein [Methanoregulaceae archaeon]
MTGPAGTLHRSDHLSWRRLFQARSGEGADPVPFAREISGIGYLRQQW